jgi:hypothetical protein
MMPEGGEVPDAGMIAAQQAVEQTKSHATAPSGAGPFGRVVELGMRTTVVHRGTQNGSIGAHAWTIGVDVGPEKER